MPSAVVATRVAVIVDRKKRLGRAEPDDLRRALADAGVEEPTWYEVPKSKKAPKAARKAGAAGAQLLLVWGGDGTVRQCIDELADDGIPIGILPAGTANLLANGLGIPIDLTGNLDAALHGRRQRIDVGIVNGERFAVMAATGVDAAMIAGADDAKDRIGRLAYVWSGMKAVRIARVPTRITVDDVAWFDGCATCVLVGNLGTVSGGLVVFDQAEPDDGRLKVGVVTDGALDWIRVLVRIVRRQPNRTPLVRTISGTIIDIRLARRRPYGLDGGDRKPTKHLKITLQPSAIELRAPAATGP